MATFNITASKDANTRSGGGDTNYGTADIVTVKNGTYTVDRDGYFEFDLSSLSGETITSADLHLVGSSNDLETADFRIDLTATGWSETGITWNSPPSVTTSNVTTFSPPHTEGGYVDVDVTSVVAAAVASGAISFRIVAPTQQSDSHGINFASKEHANSAYHPKLIVITEGAGNADPVVDAGEDQTITLPSSATLDGDAYDADLDDLTTLWTKVSGPGTVTFGDASAVDTTASFSTDGIYVLQLAADDGNSGTDTDTVTITVNEAPPVVPVESGQRSCTLSLSISL